MPKKILVVSHTARQEAIAATQHVVQTLHATGVDVVLSAEDAEQFTQHLFFPVQILGRDAALAEIDIALVLGGDGTILRAAELVRGSDCPIVGVNLGHVGFLAELERHDLDTALAQVRSGEYTVEERGTLAVEVYAGNELITQTFAVNEAAIEKTSRMIEVAVGVDGRALTGFGCDGVVVATATGSTAYAFSAGGPVMWPDVDATLVVPIAAHALFNRPLVVGPDQVVEVQLLVANTAVAALWCDGRRRFTVEPGQRVMVRRSTKKLRLARLDEGLFADRLVNKFNLPVTSWREAVR